MPTSQPTAASYFPAMHSALGGLETLLSAANTPFAGHNVIAGAIAPYVERLRESMKAWEHKFEVDSRLTVSQTSGFPSYESVLSLENDSKNAASRLAEIPEMSDLKSEMVDHILRYKTFPTQIRKQLSERSYFERVERGSFFNAHVLPQTIRVSVNPKNRRPYYVVTWGTYDGPNALPMIYMATIEDSSERMCRALVTSDGRLNPDIRIDLPVGGLLNHDYAAAFDRFAESNCDFALSLVTIATNLDKDFDFLHPKQLRRFIIGPFYSTAVEGESSGVSDLLQRTRSPHREDPWLLTWTTQEVFSKHEKAARRGLWSFDPARDEFHIETRNLECLQQGVSSFEKHILVPHETYQALYATREAEKFFGGFKIHTLSGNQVISGV
ncbi:hypothetical protein D3C71_175350 [compost metagenome]